MGNDTNPIRGASRECLCHGWTLSLNISKLSNLERHTKPEGLADTLVHDRLDRIPELTDNEGRDSIPTSYDRARFGLLSSADLLDFYIWFGHKLLSI
ncbi:hypothetical protein VNO77_42265 [Canavalia gladiata]|uniref:Uncharacterized protein n=1 Tax=Canavalia gladiata TaxID=3824 RepID=A0AAN9PQV2_CANGL